MLLQARKRLDQRIWRCHDSLLITPRNGRRKRLYRTGTQGLATVMIQGQKRGGGSPGTLASPKGNRQSGGKHGRGSLVREGERMFETRVTSVGGRTTRRTITGGIESAGEDGCAG